MTHNYCSPDSCNYLGDNNNTSTGNVIKRLASVLAVAMLIATGIWLFTPVSRDADYKLEQAKNTNHIDAHPVIPTASPTENGPAEGIQHAEQFGDSKLVMYEAPAVNSSSIDFMLAERMLPSAVNYVYDDHIDRHKETEYQRFYDGPYARVIKPRSAKDIGKGRIETFTIQSGDTLTRIFSRADLPISRAIELTRNKSAKALTSLSIGKTMRIYFDENNQWESLEYDQDKLNMLIVAPAKKGFAVNQYTKQVRYRTDTAHGVITSTLGDAAEQAQISAGVTQALIDIFKWEIDFARDLKAGDTFSVVYQKAYIDGEFVDNGPVLAASITTGGRLLEAVRYTDSEGVTAYFQPDGSSLKRSFLRTPVKIGRITSTFGKRFHPIKKKWTMHLGVDYGARRGTPIIATAEGVVQYAGKKGGYGNTVILRHGGKYATLYAHMSKIGKGVRAGKAVNQGQVIGYVGHSGWATGDHLHYEFRVNGKHRDPLKVKLPKSQPLAKKEMDNFRSQAEPLLGTLAAIQGEASQVAKLDKLPVSHGNTL